MTENLKKFQEALKADDDLKQKLGEELKRVLTEQSEESEGDALIKAAKSLGYDLSKSDFDKLKASTQELDPNELEKVSGGWCWWDFSCYTVRCDSEALEILNPGDCGKQYTEGGAKIITDFITKLF